MSRTMALYVNFDIFHTMMNSPLPKLSKTRSFNFKPAHDYIDDVFASQSQRQYLTKKLLKPRLQSLAPVKHKQPTLARPQAKDAKFDECKVEPEVTLQLVAKRNLITEGTNTTEDLSRQIQQLLHIRLDNEQITSIAKLPCPVRIKKLLLHSNKITLIERLSAFTTLTFLVLSNNKIADITPLKDLDRLLVLDLSNNKIQSCNYLPCNLEILDLRENDCQKVVDARMKIIGMCTNLRDLDGQQVSSTERMIAKRLGGIVSKAEFFQDSRSESSESSTESTSDMDDCQDYSHQLQQVLSRSRIRQVLLFTRRTIQKP